MRWLRLAAVAVLAAGVSGCSYLSSSDDSEIVDDRPPNEIFADAQAQLDGGEPVKAAKTFNEVERLYPFSQLAKRAVIMSAYSSYKGRDYASARASAQRYLDLYPSDVDAPYAQYLIGLTYYDNIVDVGRDQGMTQDALRALTEVVRRYPSSDYAREAKLKIDLTKDHLAAKEMSVGRYYLKRGHYTAAVNRFKTVIDKYQTTSQVPEAMHRLVEAYLALGLEEEARSVAAVLGHNFPGSDWYADSYALLTGRQVREKPDDDGFFSRTYRTVIQGKWR